MNFTKESVLFDRLKNIRRPGEYFGSIISKCQGNQTLIVFSDNVNIKEDNSIEISDGLIVGFEDINEERVAYSRKSDFLWNEEEKSSLEYSVLIPSYIMDQYDEGQFSDAFPFTINLLHTAGLYLNNYRYKLDHLNFFKGEILKNPVSSIYSGVLVADRVVIDHRGDPVFYDCLIVGRDQNDDLSVSYEPLANVDDKVVEYIIILGIESLKD
ncbi:MAG: hypothetical protein GF383_04760 [Candidatus Lokiarchaeota archaeon]|nr:hypothetical protein [Candidatus Lokiarchaeota archaeon]MBD3339107.1 hypothetical protein [Candidatus Lokiarchaeota archaeon]